MKELIEYNKIFSNGSLNPIHHGLFWLVKPQSAPIPPLKISKTKNDLSMKLPNRSICPLSPLFYCFRVWFVSGNVTMASFL